MVTFAFPPMTFGGISTLSYDLASSLSREGVEVHVLTAGIEGEEYYDSSSFRVTRLKVPVHSKLRKFPAFQFKVWRWLRGKSKAFDVIHFQENSGFLYFLFNLFNKRGNTIEEFHHSPAAEFLFHLRYLFMAPRETIPYLFIPVEILQEYFSLKRAGQIVAVSEHSGSTLRSWGISPGKIAVIPNGISESFLKGVRPRRPLRGNIKFLYVGRLIPRKGVDTLIAAVDVLNKKGINNFHVEIVGQGPLFKHCRKTIEKGNLSNCLVRGAVAQSELEELYREADCFVCPSHLEGFGIVLLEAAANGLAIIANDIPVFREVFPGDELLFFKRDDPEDLAGKMRAIIDDPQLVPTLGARAFNGLERYKWQNVVREYIRLYSRMVDGQR